MLKRFVRFYRPQLGIFLPDLTAATLMAGIDLLYPIFTRILINDAVPNGNLRALGIFAGTILVLYLVRWGLQYFNVYYGHMIGVKMEKAMRSDIFKKLQQLPFAYFDNNRTGVIMSRIINDLENICELAHHGPEDLLISLVTLVGAFFYLCTVNVSLTLIVFAFLPVMVFYTFGKRKKMQQAFRAERETIAEVNASVENAISGIRVTRAFTGADHEMQKFSASNDRYVEAIDLSYKTMAEYNSGLTLTMNMLSFAVFAGGGYFTLMGHIDYGDWAAYLLFIPTFLAPIRRLLSFVEQYQRGMAGFARFCDLMDHPEELDPVDGIDIGAVRGDITFSHVAFRYGAEGPEVLREVDFSLTAGRTLALVGASGGGKTTICQLLPRFYPVTGGDILVDGVSIYTMTGESLRRNIAIVQQDVFLFTGTAADNILYGRPDATPEEVVEAAKMANIHEDILKMPQGYDSEIGERGVKLSGGQKQRIAIARAFLKNPPILILDEATSALDTVTEQAIQQSLQTLCEGRTTLLVAHRLSTVRHADEILVVQEGQVAERGTHESLMAAGGIYCGLYRQSGDGILQL